MKTGSSSASRGPRRRRRAAIVAMTAGLVVFAACGTSPASSSPTPTTSTTVPAPGYARELGPVLAELVESMQVPSAVVVVRSPEFGDATFRFGSRVLGGDELPATVRSLPDRQHHQDDDGDGHLAVGPGRQGVARRSDLQVPARRAQRRQHHDRPVARHAQRTGRLHRGPRVPAGSGRGPRTDLESRRAPGTWRSARRRCSRRGRPGSTRTPTTSCSDW